MRDTALVPTPWAAQSWCFSYREQPGVLPGANNIFGKYVIMGHGGSISKHKNFGLRLADDVTTAKFGKTLSEPWEFLKADYMTTAHFLRINQNFLILNG